MALQVIGAGFGRTGTASLKVALERLGLGRCYHMSEVLEDPSHIDLWLEAVAGNPDWDRLLGAYAATVDFPACIFWRELADVYPDAKVLLSVRDPAQWFESTQATIMSPRFVEYLQGTPFGELNDRAIRDWFERRTHDRAYMIGRFEQHVEDVKRGVPADRLLVYEVKSGWEPLCEFL
jgi:hypothetical protein